MRQAWLRFRYYWRQQMLVIVGLAIAIAVAMSSLSLGASAAQQLQAQAALRLGTIDRGLVMEGRFVDQALGKRLYDQESETTSVLSLRSIVSAPDQQKQHPRVFVHGVEKNFFYFSPLREENDEPPIALDGLAINELLAKHLGVTAGDDLIVRVEKPSLLSKDAPLSPDDEQLVTLRLPLKYILGDKQFGSFQLSSSPDPAMNVFLPLELLQETVELDGLVNQIFIPDSKRAQELEQLVNQQWTLADCGISFHQRDQANELQSNRIFIDDFIVKAAGAQTQTVFSYMVNAFQNGERATPYSIVAALDETLMRSLPGQATLSVADDEIVLNQWLADDLQAQVGDRIAMRYFQLLPNNELQEQSVELRVAAIVPISGLAADEYLMPPFPGLAGKDDCREWDPGAQIDLEVIRDKDEEYWDDYQGTPKAFIALSLGQQIWGNRFGKATALRFSGEQEAFASELRANLSASQFGLHVVPIADYAKTAGQNGARYVTSVFFSLNGFLLIAALIVVALFYRIALQQRLKEFGLLAAQGYTWKRISRLFLGEYVCLFLVSAVFGVGGAYAYDAFLSAQLAGDWQAAAAQTDLGSLLDPLSMLMGLLLVAVLSYVLLWRGLRLVRKERIPQLLKGRMQAQHQKPGSPLIVFIAACVLLVVAVLLVLYLPLAPNDPMRYFAAAFCLLIAGLCLFAGMNRFILRSVHAFSQMCLLLRNMALQGRRHMMLLIVFAACVFLILSSAAFKFDPNQDHSSRRSGAGGFEWFASSSLPLELDLQSAAGLDLYALDAEDLAGVNIVMLRANNDEETSCLNLNQSTRPRLWGVNTTYLADEQAFPFMQALATEASPWTLLGEKREGRIPVIGDVNSILWSMGKGLGSQFVYADEFGVEHELEVVALLQDTILQGGLLMDERYFSELFPSTAGYRNALIDCPPQRSDELRDLLESSLRRQGFTMESSVDRLSRYASVRNAYIQIFQSIGALGIALGSIGIAAIVLRYVLERRAEFALMRASGFTLDAIKRQVFAEHSIILCLGLLLGLVTALLTLLPLGQFEQLGQVVVPLLFILVCGLLATYIASRIALRGQILSALRDE